MGDEPLVPQRVENAIRKRLQELALVDCEPDIAAFAACAQERTVSVVWACRTPLQEMKRCTNWWGQPEHMIPYKRGYIELQKERGEFPGSSQKEATN